MNIFAPRFDSKLSHRQTIGKLWVFIFRLMTLTSVFFLVLLLVNIINQSFGFILVDTRVDPTTLSRDGNNLEELDKQSLIDVLKENVSFKRFEQLNLEEPLENQSREKVYDLVYKNVLKPEVIKTWFFFDSLLHKEQIRQSAEIDFPNATLSFKSWLSPELISNSQSSKPLEAGVRTALFGSVWTIMVTILVAFPMGVGAAIYLEELAVDNHINRLIQTNVNNLAGVPSIIYGMLGLAIFVRVLAPFTSGSAFGFSEGGTLNGRTILSAGLTLALLVLPVIIINTQEAIKAVPDSLRQASYGLGATRWQTIWHHVLPNALPGILTGTILAISRALGETAPLVVVGAATFITFDPKGVFSKFTTLPIQIYQWSSRPQAEFQHLAAGAILVLLALLLTLNSFAIVMRNRNRKK